MPSTFNTGLNRALANDKNHCALDPRAARIETWEAWGRGHLHKEY